MCIQENCLVYLNYTIVVGRNQNVNAECDVKAFTFWGGKIARRRSGGGAVYHDLGNLNYSILTTQLNKDKLRYQDLMVGLIETYDMTLESAVTKMMHLMGVYGKDYSSICKGFYQTVSYDILYPDRLME